MDDRASSLRGQHARWRVGSLFSGIGGFDLGLERTGGFETAWFCEQDPFCQNVLADHWPGIPIHPDITTLKGAAVAPIDVLCGGFPCQDISSAGTRAGLAGARSGLWSEYARLVGELRPRYVLVENVSDLLVRGLGVVLGDLAALGYDAEWDCIPASAVGAPHQRDRVWLVAYPDGSGRDEGLPVVHARQSDLARSGEDPDADRARRKQLSEHHGGPVQLGGRAPRRHADGLRDEVADADGQRRGGRPGDRGPGGRDEPPHGGRASAGTWPPDVWAVEPDVGRVAHGVPARVDRLRALGNALVPQIAEWIGNHILAYEHAQEGLGHAA